MRQENPRPRLCWRGLAGCAGMQENRGMKRAGGAGRRRRAVGCDGHRSWPNARARECLPDDAWEVYEHGRGGARCPRAGMASINHLL